MDSEASSNTQMLGIAPRLFPSLGPALLICIGYIDPGKWVAAVDGGARFGSDLILLLLAFNCTAILCHYLSARIGVVTGKNLAQICNEEYSKSTCIILGVQAELSVVSMDLTMTLGVAHGLSLLFGLDLFTCIFLTAIDAVLFPLFVNIMAKCKPEMLLMSIAGVGLILYLLGVLISQPEIPLVMNVVFPSLGGDSAFSLLCLLGASIMPHNLYLHSSIVKQQKLPDVSTGALCHDHFFAILFSFSGIFLVNYVVMLSAATVFHSAGLPVLTFQDSLLLMDQIFRSPIVPFLFFLVLFSSSQVAALTWNLGGQVVLHHLLGIDPPIWIHRVTVKAFATILALYCAWTSGAEGIYQMLIFSQVILAMLLPTSVIPLFRVASSKLIMGAFKISGFLEILALSAFLVMVALNLIFIVEMLFGDNDLMGNMIWSIHSSTILPSILLLTACVSLISMLWLAATPLKSVTTEIQLRSWDLQKFIGEPSENRNENELSKSRYIGDDDEPLAEEATFEKKSEANQSDNSVVDFDIDLPETIPELVKEPNQSAFEDDYTLCTSPASHPEESSSVELTQVDIADKIPSEGLLDASTIHRTQSKEPEEEAVGTRRDVHVVKDDDEADVWELEEPPARSSGSGQTPTSDGPGSFKSISGKSDDASNGGGSLSRLCGLGRAARRQLAAILDEFWGQLFDFHGQVTHEAKGKRIDLLLGLNQKSVSFNSKTDPRGNDYMSKYFSEGEKGSVFLTNPRDYDSPNQQRTLSGLDSSYGVQMGSSSWSTYMQPWDAYRQSSGIGSLDDSERRYSSLRLPAYSGDRNYQPATIHGYQLASYASRIAADRNLDPMSVPLDSPTSISSSLISDYKDQLTFGLGQNRSGSLNNTSLPNSGGTLMNRLPPERLYCNNNSLVGSNVNVGSSAYPKKYHSLPDISGLVVPNRKSSLAKRSNQWSSAVGPGLSVGRNPYDQSFYTNTMSSTEGGPLAFDELSPSKLYRDAFSLPSNSNLDTKSLWSRQPFEQLFGIEEKARGGGSRKIMQGTISHDLEAKLLQSFRYCITRLLKLEGSEWLFRQNGGSDEELIDRVAVREKCIYEAEAREANWVHMGGPTAASSDHRFGPGLRNDEAGLTKFPFSSVPHCGEGCIWRTDLIVCFGVWCIHRILEMSLMESRPELWGKYTYVLNRLQGILDLAFSNPRSSLSPCFCLQRPSIRGEMSNLALADGLSPTGGKVTRGQCTSPATLLELIKDVEISVSSRKGRTGTAAGDVAFPKGKENLASVLKRYKRRLLNKSTGTHEGGPGLRKAPMPPSTSFTL